MVLIILFGLIYNMYLSYPMMIYNIQPKYDNWEKLKNQLKKYNVVDNDNDNDNDKLSLDIEINNESRNNSLLTPSLSLFKHSELIDDDDMSIISSICDGVDVIENDDVNDSSSTHSSIHINKRNISQASLVKEFTASSDSRPSSRKNTSSIIYHYPRDSMDTFYGSMQRTINTIKGFLKLESEANSIENQDLLNSNGRTKAVNLMRSNSKL